MDGDIMDFIDLFRFFLILIVPGIISAIIFGFIACLRREPTVATTLIFDLWTFIIMITGLYFFKGIVNMTSLIASFNCLSFTRRYALLSIFIGIFLAVTSGLIYRLIFRCRRR